MKDQRAGRIEPSAEPPGSWGGGGTRRASGAVASPHAEGFCGGRRWPGVVSCLSRIS